MYPELIKFGNITLYSYGAMILLGLISGYFYFLKQTKEMGLDSEKVSSLFLWGIAGVFLGGKFFYFLEDPKLFFGNPEKMLENPGSGFVFYGSFIVTTMVFIIWFKKNKLPVLTMFDLVGISGAMVHGFGKIGCFLAGCCHGKICLHSWGVVFSNTKSSANPLNTPLYPTQLWDAAIIFFTIGIMIFLKNRKQFHGQLFLIYGIIYAIGRFITEKYRGDEERGFLFNGLLSHSQFIAICIFTICLAFYFYLWKKQKSVS